MYASTDEYGLEQRAMTTKKLAPSFMHCVRSALPLAQLVTVLPIIITAAASGLKGTPLPAVVMVGSLCAAFGALQIADRFTKRLSSGARIAIALASAVIAAQFATYWTATWIIHSDYVDLFEIPPGITRGQIMDKLRPEPALLIGAASGLMQFGLWAAFSVVPEVLERERTRKLELEKLVLEATHLRTRAEITRLKSQLEPHFLLNTLNLISGLVTQNPERARDVLVTFGDLLQDALIEHEDLHSIAQEVEWLKRYVDILEARHGDLLKVDWHVEASANDALLPRLLLQPLLENAIQHGALCKNGTGSVRVRIARLGDKVQCSIIDNGPGIGDQRPKAIGLENVRGRIRVHFADGDFELLRCEDETVARVVLPYSLANQLQLNTRETR
jgi:signal transduction histidine kinase